MWPPSSYASRDLSTTGMESGGTTLVAPELSTPTISSEPVVSPIDTNNPAARTMAPPPTYVTYQASFEPFTTDQYMFPEQDSWSLTWVSSPHATANNSDLERFQVDNLDIKIAESMLNHTHIPSSQRWWFSEFLPRVAYEWCFWFDRSVTSEEVDTRMSNLMASMLYQFHYHILDPVSGARFSVMDLLQRVRAVRDRLHPHSRGIQWDDEWP
ncbi:hypothetical protein CspeluHIS016_0800770 [Cutaneotrichosporon spelunceum]|uniref:Uncharacterized protein n=1 Tax=Cutaneotrichosporon spelunceum TaxID=1672016 RepID=A0AAD3TYZ6_9TREE|nr:hypothetical protein CspeluHIS016_0800770 [Cutaneotrichosporon spelunceum]